MFILLYYHITLPLLNNSIIVLVVFSCIWEQEHCMWPALIFACSHLHMTLLYCSVVPPLCQNLGDLSEHNIVPHGCSQLLLDVVLAPHIKQELCLHCQPKLSMFHHVFAPQIQVAPLNRCQIQLCSGFSTQVWNQVRQYKLVSESDNLLMWTR